MWLQICDYLPDEDRRWKTIFHINIEYHLDVFLFYNYHTSRAIKMIFKNAHSLHSESIYYSPLPEFTNYVYSVNINLVIDFNMTFRNSSHLNHSPLPRLSWIT